MKLMLYNSQRNQGDWGFVERLDGHWTARNQGDRRVTFVADSADPTNNPYYSHWHTANNLCQADTTTFLAGGYFDAADPTERRLARWERDAIAPGQGRIVPDVRWQRVSGAGLDLPSYATSRPGGGAYHVIGGVVYTSTGADPITASGDWTDWQFRTATEDLFSLDATHEGWGNDTHDLGTEIGVVPWDGTFATYDTTLGQVPPPSHTPPGFGKFWAPRLLGIARVNGVWLGPASGPIYDNDNDPIDPGAPPAGYANGLLYCDGDNPADPSRWRNCQIVLEGHRADDPDALPDSIFLWIEPRGDYLYFTASPFRQFSVASGTNSHALWWAHVGDDGTVSSGAAFSYPADHTQVGPMTQADGEMYLACLDTDAATLALYRLDSEPGGWTLLAGTPYAGDGLGTMYAASGYVHVALGQDWPVNADQLYSGAPDAATTWDVETYDLLAATWLAMAHSYPGGGATATTLPRMFPATVAVASSGGGGGGGTGGGSCDDTFSAFGASTISKATFAAHLASHPSPLLGEMTADDIYDQVLGAGVNPAFFLAQAHKESQCGAVPGAVTLAAKNPMNFKYIVGGYLQIGFVVTGDGTFAKYASYHDAILAYTHTLTGAIYAGKSISQIITIYAPPSENDTALYISQVCTNMAAWQAEM